MESLPEKQNPAPMSTLYSDRDLLPLNGLAESQKAQWQDAKFFRLRESANQDEQDEVRQHDVITSYTQSNDEKRELYKVIARFKTILSNIPGLVFECTQNENKEIVFTYLNDGCRAILDVAPEKLKANPHLLFDMILPADRASFLESMQATATSLGAWNWEGGLWMGKWHDVKSVNLRATATRSLQGKVLWSGVITNITQSKKEKQELEHSHQQLAELSSHMALVKEQERLHIAREIHDNIGGNLSAIKIGMVSLIKGLAKHQPELIEKAGELKKLVDSTFDDTHRIMADLRPGVLELGIVAALEWQAKEFENRTGIHVDFTTNDEDIDLDIDRSIVLFRICQEATTNVAKYAKADLVKIDLMHQADEVVMQIIDNGIGIKSEDKLKKHAFGLRGMIERVQAVGGQISIEPGPMTGTKISIRLPYHSCCNLAV